MNTNRAAGLLAVMTTAMTGTAQAAEVGLRVFGGWTAPMSQDFDLDREGGARRSSGLDFDGGFAVGGALGFEINPKATIEAEYVHRASDADLKGTRNTDTASTRSNAVMVNALYHFGDRDAEGSIRPYLGAGIGAADLRIDRDDLDLDSDFGLAYQAIAGVSYDVSYQASLFGEVRYFAISEQSVENDDYSFDSGYDSFDILIGYGYRF